MPSQRHEIVSAEDHPDIPSKDIFTVYWYELSSSQKRFIQARVVTDTDTAACSYLHMEPRNIANWKTKDKNFMRVYHELVDNPQDANQSLLQNGIVFVTGSALENIRSYLQEDSPSKERTDQARLAKDILVEMTKRQPKEVGRPLAEPEKAKAVKGLPTLVFDVEELTRETMNRLPEEGSIIPLEEEDDE